MDYFFAVLDRLTANVAHTSLGTGGSVIIAPLFQYDFNQSEHICLTTKGTVQLNTPFTQLRSFKAKTNLASLNRDYTDPTKTAENYAFINNRIQQIFFPEVIKSHVTPGTIIELSEACTFSHGWFEGCLGYDFWWKGKEHVKLLCTPSAPIDFCPGIAPSAYAHKLFGDLQVFLDRKSTTLQVGIMWDATFASKGIGKDFTLALDFRILF